MKAVYILLAVVLALIAVLGFFTLREGAADDGRAHRLVVVSPHPEPVLLEFERAFSAWKERQTGRPVRIDFEDHGGTSSIVRYINAEFANSPEGIGIDVFWGGGFEPYVMLGEQGRLEAHKVPDEIMDNLIPDVGGVPTRDAEHRWYGSALSGFGIMFNKMRLQRLGVPFPKTWQDLAEANLFGEVAAADPRRSGSAHMCYEIMLQSHGWEEGWGVLTRMAANSRSFYEGASDVPRNISLGQASVGPVIDFYAWSQIREDGPDRIGFLLPDALTVVNPDSIGVLRGARNKQLAFEFVEFILSEEGQKLWILKQGAPGGPVRSELGRIPVRPDVYRQHRDETNVTFDISEFRSDFRFDPEADSRRRAAFKDLYGSTLIDAHPELVAAWRAVIDRGLKPEDVAELCAPFLGEEELARMSTQNWNDPAFRNRMIGEWSNQARERYRRLARR